MEQAHFNPMLGEWMGRRDKNGSIVLNSHFSGWRHFLAMCLDDSRDYTVAEKYNGTVRRKTDEVDWKDVRRFKKGRFKDLLKECREHSKSYDGKRLGKDVMVLVHPMYLHIMEHYLLRKEHEKRQGDEYFTRMKGALLWAKDADINVVMIEIPQHYAAVTSIWVERGLVDRAIFSQYDSGFVLDRRNLKSLKGRNVYFCGGYDGRCLTDAMEDAVKARGEKEMHVIQDLVVYKPFHSDIIIGPKKVHPIGSHSLPTLTLDQVVRRVEGTDKDYFSMPEAPQVKVC